MISGPGESSITRKGSREEGVHQAHITTAHNNWMGSVSLVKGSCCCLNGSKSEASNIWWNLMLATGKRLEAAKFLKNQDEVCRFWDGFINNNNNNNDNAFYS